MGVCLHMITGNGPVSKKQYSLKTGFVWVIGRRDDKVPTGQKADWHLQGVASTERSAIEMCLDETYFIGPLPLDTALPHETIEWVGLYFPLRTQSPSKRNEQ